MFTLLHPAALLALTGLLVPVAIHLWNRRPAREVAVGSLRWLATGANRRLRNLKLEQLWLLLLRAALLAVLAVAVAAPVWRTVRPASRGVVLLSPEVVGLPALATVRATVDSLRRQGYGLRWLDRDFQRVPGAVWRAGGQPGRVADSVRVIQTGDFAWARVQQAAAAFPGQPLLVLTSARLRHLQGSHVPLPANVRWQVLPDTATTSWLAAAEIVGDSLHLLVGRSSETQTKSRRNSVRKQPNGELVRVAGLAPMRFQLSQRPTEKPLLVATVTTDSATSIRVETAPLVVEMYASPEFAADARYLEAAIRAASVGIPIPPLVRRSQQLPKRLNADWTFWLSEEPLPPGWQQYVEKSGGNIWKEAAGPGVADTAQLATTAASAAPVTVFRREAGQAARGSETLWTDGRGRPVLSRQALGQGGVYHLHTRLSPTWSQLADGPQLPARLLALLQPEATDEAAASLFQPRNLALAQRLAHFDQRGLDPTQLAAGPSELRPAATTASLAQSVLLTDLRPWLVLAAGLLFLLERLLARRRESQASTNIPI